MKHQLTAMFMSTLIAHAAPTESVECREGKYYEFHSEKPYSGYFTRYYQDGLKRESEGKVKDGVMNDVWEFYYPNGNLKCEAEFADGIKIKVLKSNYETGEKESEFDELNQTFTTWYKSGRIKSVSHYLYGLKQGSCQEWYESGALKSDYTYYTHHEHGICKEYYESGQVSLIAVYRDGKKSGFWQAFYLDGKLKFQGRYSEDSKTGKWVTRDQKGKLTKELF
jgi:antitoxin component YwqK of YwqJK toxin-antitoxin module